MTELRTNIPDEVDHYLDSLINTGPFNSKAELLRAALAAYTSMTGPMAQVYDKETIFSPDGRIYQVEYARESALRGLPCVGVNYDKGILLTARTGITDVGFYPKIHRVSNEVGMAFTGFMADGLATVRHVRKESPKTNEDLVDGISEWYWENSSRRDRRPLGVSFLVASVLEGKPRLFFFEPNGGIIEGRTVAVGRGSERIQAVLSTSGVPKTIDDAEVLVRQALDKPEKWQHDDMLHLKAR